MKKKIKLIIISLFVLCAVIGIPQTVVAEKNDCVAIDKSISVDETSNGYQIPKGSTIHHKVNGITDIFSKNERILSINEAEASFVVTPNGLMKANRVYEVPSGTYVDDKGQTLYFIYNDTLILTVIDDKFDSKSVEDTIPATGGWVEAAWETGKKPDYFYSEWEVPSDPYNPQQDIVNFLFPGILNYSGSALIQPVLEWNNSGSGGWTISAWYVTSGRYVRASVESASEGDLIIGTLENYGDSDWHIVITNDDTDEFSILSVGTDIPVDPIIGNVLCIAFESYHLTNGNIYDTDVPGTTDFENISITKNGNPINMQWSDQFWGSFPYLTDLDVTWSGVSEVTLHTAY